MLYPQTNTLRQHIDLSGFWEFRPDPDGVANAWHQGFSDGRPIAVPASWNELFDDVFNYWSDGWYQTHFDLPWNWDTKRVRIRFGSVNYIAEVWLNGNRLGEHEGGHLPFEFDITKHLQAEKNLLVVRVNGEPQPNQVPPGNVRPDPMDTFATDSRYPLTSYDFFPYCGIHRPVLIYATSHQCIEDLTVVTTIEGTTGLVHTQIQQSGSDKTTLRLNLSGHGIDISDEIELRAATGELTLEAPQAALWSPDAPNLYQLEAKLLQDGTVIDRYQLNIGIRTIKVEGDQILLNDKPIELLGFGRHEDFYLNGRGYSPTVLIRDYEIMRWVGANSFRTTHYPYSEQMLDMADRLGFLVIAETPSVEMYFHEDGLEERIRAWKQLTQEMIMRDKNHPSVIMWSLANEPHNRRPQANASFASVFELARSLDTTRPVTFVSYLGLNDEALEHCDVICINRYRGWYSESGQIDLGVQKLGEELDTIHERFGLPVLITEFGTDTIAGLHHSPPVMFSEEYQAEFITRYVELMNEKPFVVGQHVWNLCDFRTGQSTRRIGAMNLKGVFTRERTPKLAAHRLRKLWHR